MAKFKNKELKVSFELPDVINCRDQLRFFGANIGMRDDESFIRMWEGAKSLIEKWDCSYFNYEDSLDEAVDPRITRVIIWVGGAVARHMNSLEKTEKK